MSNLPLSGLIVLEFSQYLSGPSAGLRLADLGARVIKIERPGVGDAGRKLAIKNLWVDDNSLLFNSINRNKESFTCDLKNKTDIAAIKKIISKADVIIHNFRPGVMEKATLGYHDVEMINPSIVYGVISGYGKTGPWKGKPGQDLLIQSIAGLAFTTGNGSNGPVPFGLSVADILSGAQLVQGILAALIRKQKTGKGALIEISLLESLLDFQFELLTTYYATDILPQRSGYNNAHPLLSAPYGIYKTADGYLALAMMDLRVLADAIQCSGLRSFASEEAFAKRDEIKRLIAAHLLTQPTVYWLSRLQERDLWAMELLNWEHLLQQEAYKVLQMEQWVETSSQKIKTTRCPIRINGDILFNAQAAPALGAHNQKIATEFRL